MHSSALLLTAAASALAHAHALPVADATPAVTTVPLVTFDGASHTTYKFEELNDPVMGGRSTGTWQLNASAGFGVFNGQVVDVPALKAPGFIKTAADGKFADLSSVAHGNLVLMVRTATPDYAGFRVSFAAGALSPAYSCAGGGGIPLSRGCFKTNFTIPAGDSFTAIRLPFSSFSDEWSSATGQQTKTCAKDKNVCPTAAKLREISRIELWGEGALGRVHLEIQSIFAEAASSAPAAAVHLGARPPKAQDTCDGAVQKKLRYALSGRPASIPVALGPKETLADAICCDKRAAPYAEPQFLFEAPDVMLFQKIAKDGVTTFYDAVCGLPLFEAPKGRSFADFQADSKAHGWPSFRTGEVVLKNVVTNNATGYVTSKCGTHLGSYLPDSKGSRWCIDLSCIAGSPK